jgi:hypothetical protein
VEESRSEQDGAKISLNEWRKKQKHPEYLKL